jgi:hypothetical protein
MDTIQFAVAAAVHAPAVHNTQPWRFGRGERLIDVYAAGRRLRVADPAGRELPISCGAAVFTLRVALRYLGWLPHARLFPDPSRPALVARVSWDEDRIAAYPAEPAHTEPDFPGRDFAAGKGWGQAAAAGERSPGTVCLLATSANEPADWVAAGRPCGGSCFAPPPAAWPRPGTASRSTCRSCATSSGSSWRRARIRS